MSWWSGNAKSTRFILRFGTAITIDRGDESRRVDAHLVRTSRRKASMGKPRFTFTTRQLNAVVRRINAGVVPSCHISAETFLKWANSAEIQDDVARYHEFVWCNTHHLADGTCVDMEEFTEYQNVIYIVRGSFTDSRDPGDRKLPRPRSDMRKNIWWKTDKRKKQAQKRGGSKSRGASKPDKRKQGGSRPNGSDSRPSARSRRDGCAPVGKPATRGTGGRLARDTSGQAATTPA